MDKMILKGNIAFSVSLNEMKTYEDSYIVVEKGMVKGISKKIPDQFKDFKLIDYGDRIIMPGFVDLHIHAPQVFQSGVGMDLELLDWLKKYTFHQEEQFSNIEYAQSAYIYFVDELVKQGTLNASVYATIHKEATDILFETLSKKGVRAFVGKVNMDQNCSNILKEDTNRSILETEQLIIKYKDHPFVKPIITPRFAPTCSWHMLEKLGQLCAKYNTPVQSHLSENIEEIKWVRKLFPEVNNYSEVYHKSGLLGQFPTLMAHCIHLEDEEIELIRINDVIAVHCPESNLNLASGIMPVRKLINKGIKVRLGTDVGGGHSLAMTKVMVRAIQLSKMLSLFEKEEKPLTFEEVFYMATKGNGSFFGKVGSLEEGYSFDAIVMDDRNLGSNTLNLMERLQRFIYIGDDRNIVSRFVNGSEII